MPDSPNDPAPPAPESSAEEQWWPAASAAPGASPGTHTPAAGPAPAARSPLGSRPRLVLVAAGLVAVAIAGAIDRSVLGDGDDPADTVTADAPAGGPGNRGGTAGTITAVEGTTITLDADGDAVEVTTTDDTAVTDTSEGTIEDIAPGDAVLALGDQDDTGTLTATAIITGADLATRGGPMAGAPSGGAPPDREPPQGAERAGTPEGRPPEGGPSGTMASGTVASFDDETLVLAPDDGDAVTVDVSATPTVQVVTELTVADLAVGDEVTVSGEPDGGTVAAASIQRGAGGLGGPGARGPASGSESGED